MWRRVVSSAVAQRFDDNREEKKNRFDSIKEVKEEEEEEEEEEKQKEKDEAHQRGTEEREGCRDLAGDH